MTAEQIVVQEKSRNAAVAALNLDRIVGTLRVAQRFLACAIEDVTAAHKITLEVGDRGLQGELETALNYMTLARLAVPDIGALEQVAEKLRALSYGDSAASVSSVVKNPKGAAHESAAA